MHSLVTHTYFSKGTHIYNLQEEKEDKESYTIFKFLKSQADKLVVAQRCWQKLRTMK